MKVVLEKGAYMPELAHENDAGYDLRTPERVVLRKHDCADIDTGVRIAIPKDCFGEIKSKSGLSFNHSIECGAGTLDCGYTGTVHVKLYNHGGSHHIFNAGDKIAQLVIQPCLHPTLETALSLKETDRGEGGFGSTGV